MGNSKTSTFINYVSAYADAYVQYAKEERESKTSVIKDTFGCGCVIERTYWERNGKITRRKFDYVNDCPSTDCDRGEVVWMLHGEYGK